MKLRDRLRRACPLELWLLVLVGALTRLIGLGRPQATVFDEVYFKQFPANYFTHRYYFDVHPPLGKLILAGWAKLIHANPATLAAPQTTSSRYFIAIVGVSIIPLVYAIVRRLSRSRFSAGLAGLLVTLDTALIVESRFVLIDNLLLAFGLGAIYAALRWRDRATWVWLVITGMLAGAAASVKWTGLAPDTVALVIVCSAVRARKLRIAPGLLRILLILVLAAAVYVGSFAVHFALLNKAGPGDAFMSPQFQATIPGDPYYNPKARMPFVSKFFELNREMYTANQTLTGGAPYSSKWYTWPFMERPVYYWEGPVLGNGRQGNIYLFGNPAGWWLGSLAVIVSMVLVAVPACRKRLGRMAPVLGILLFAYFVDWLPFAGIGRVMFLYHYLFAFIFSAMLLACLVGSAVPRHTKQWSPRVYAAIGLCVLVIAGFAYFAPLAYGWPLSVRNRANHVWFSTWQ